MLCECVVTHVNIYMNTVTQWELQNASPGAVEIVKSCDSLTVLGYSEVEFPDFEQRFMAHPTLRNRMRDLLRAGAVRWHHNDSWPEFDQLLAWRGTPVAHPGAPSRHFVCQNLNHRQHRYNLVRLMYLRGLHPHSSISYGNRNLPWDNCDCGRIHWDEPYTGKDPVLQQLHTWFEPDPRYSDPQWCWLQTVELQGPPVNVWHDHALSIVTETSKSDTRSTEKTWQAILYNQPFVSVTGAGWHSEFESQGYRLSHNAINYAAFDAQPRAKDRIHALVDQLEELVKLSPQELYDSTCVAAEHNHQLLIQRMCEMKLPKAVKRITRGKHSPGALRFYENTHRVLEAVNQYASSR